jgi:hypothetical protein
MLKIKQWIKTIDTEEVFLLLTGGVLWFALISGVLLGWSI